MLSVGWDEIDPDELDPETNAKTWQINAAALRVHSMLGPGLPEKVYELALQRELRSCGHVVDRQKRVQVFYDGKPLGITYRIDLLVDDKFVIELKAVEVLTLRDKAQVVSYLRLVNRRVGILYNFNVERLSEGGMRRVLNPSLRSGKAEEAEPSRGRTPMQN